MTEFLERLEALFEDFTRRARVYPVLIAALPALVQIAVIWPDSPLVALAPLVLVVGLLSLFAEGVRARGQALEERLIQHWDGLPTRHMLRLTSEGANKYLTEQRRSLVEALSGMSLPTLQQERRNPSDAADRIDSAVRLVIPLVKGREEDEILHKENISYNFRRNLLAIRNISIGVAVLCLGLDVTLYVFNYQRRLVLLAAAVTLLMAILQIAVVREGFVHRAANGYARRFFEALQIKRREMDLR